MEKVYRAGAGITDHLSRIYDYSVIQTDMRCLRTFYTSTLCQHTVKMTLYVVTSHSMYRMIQVSWLNNVFWLYCINSYHLRAQLRYFNIATELSELPTIVCNTEHKCLYYRPQRFIY